MSPNLLKTYLKFVSVGFLQNEGNITKESAIELYDKLIFFVRNGQEKKKYSQAKTN